MAEVANIVVTLQDIDRLTQVHSAVHAFGDAKLGRSIRCCGRLVL